MQFLHSSNLQAQKQCGAPNRLPHAQDLEEHPKHFQKDIKRAVLSACLASFDEVDHTSLLNHIVGIHSQQVKSCHCGIAPSAVHLPAYMNRHVLLKGTPRGAVECWLARCHFGAQLHDKGTELGQSSSAVTDHPYLPLVF